MTIASPSPSPTCERCGFENAGELSRSKQLLLVTPVRTIGGVQRVGEAIWVCSRCHAPGERVLEVWRRHADL